MLDSYSKVVIDVLDAVQRNPYPISATLLYLQHANCFQPSWIPIVRNALIAVRTSVTAFLTALICCSSSLSYT